MPQEPFDFSKFITPGDSFGASVSRLNQQLVTAMGAEDYELASEVLRARDRLTTTTRGQELMNAARRDYHEGRRIGMDLNGTTMRDLYNMLPEHVDAQLAQQGLPSTARLRMKNDTLHYKGLGYSPIAAQILANASDPSNPYKDDEGLRTVALWSQRVHQANGGDVIATETAMQSFGSLFNELNGIISNAFAGKGETETDESIRASRRGVITGAGNLVASGQATHKDVAAITTGLLEQLTPANPGPNAPLPDYSVVATQMQQHFNSIARYAARTPGYAETLATLLPEAPAGADLTMLLPGAVGAVDLVKAAKAPELNEEMRGLIYKEKLAEIGVGHFSEADTARKEELALGLFAGTVAAQGDIQSAMELGGPEWAAKNLQAEGASGADAMSLVEQIKSTNATIDTLEDSARSLGMPAGDIQHFTQGMLPLVNPGALLQRMRSVAEMSEEDFKQATLDLPTGSRFDAVAYYMGIKEGSITPEMRKLGNQLINAIQSKNAEAAAQASDFKAAQEAAAKGFSGGAGYAHSLSDKEIKDVTKQLNSHLFALRQAVAAEGPLHGRALPVSLGQFEERLQGMALSIGGQDVPLAPFLAGTDEGRAVLAELRQATLTDASYPRGAGVLPFTTLLSSAAGAVSAEPDLPWVAKPTAWVAGLLTAPVVGGVSDLGRWVTHGIARGGARAGRWIAGADPHPDRGGVAIMQAALGSVLVPNNQGTGLKVNEKAMAAPPPAKGPTAEQLSQQLHTLLRGAVEPPKEQTDMPAQKARVVLALADNLYNVQQANMQLTGIITRNPNALAVASKTKGSGLWGNSPVVKEDTTFRRVARNNGIYSYEQLEAIRERAAKVQDAVAKSTALFNAKQRPRTEEEQRKWDLAIQGQELTNEGKALTNEAIRRRLANQ